MKTLTLLPAVTKIARLALAAAALAAACGAAAQTLAIPLGKEGSSVIQADLLLPAGEGKAPALLIVPGEGYHRNLAITAGLAESATASGWVTLRMDWRYYTASPNNGTPSRDYNAEQAEMEAAVAFLKRHPRVDATRISVAGKSFGSIVAGRVFVNDPALRALVLLTPVCRGASDAPKNYQGLIADKRPVIVVVGNADSTCPLPNLYYWAKDGGDRIATLAFPGDHGLLVGPGANPALAPRNQRNVDFAVNSAMQWLNELSGK